MIGSIGTIFAVKNGRNEIVEAVGNIVCLENMEVVKQEAGVRPCTKNTRPYVGFHKKYPNLGILNGLGSKGVMMGPYYAIVMADYLRKGCEYEVVE